MVGMDVGAEVGVIVGAKGGPDTKGIYTIDANNKATTMLILGCLNGWIPSNLFFKSGVSQ